MRLFGLSVFLSAFLLFLVQPTIGKYILPWFGSTPGVWTTCLLFFQLLLLLGYAYAHLVVSRLSPRGQALSHLVLLVLVLLTLPITPSESLKPDADAVPTVRILLVLLLSVGAPFFLLSATGPLLQGWFIRVHPGRSPYRLYALSNLGSLLALLSYPFLFERYLKLREQMLGWSAAWVCCAAAVGLCALRLKNSPALVAPAEEELEIPRPGFGTVKLWAALAACASGLLMATTNRLCLDIAVFPLLWILPLALYLLTFIISFDHDRWYVRPLFIFLLPLAMLAAIHGLREGVDLGVLEQVGLGMFVLFICCMCCHGELARLKPHPRHLTLFYLAIAVGGAVGGIFVAIVAPLVFRGIYEYHLLLALCYLLVLMVVARDLLLPRPEVSASRPARIAALAGWSGFVLVVIVLTGVFLDPTRWVIDWGNRETMPILRNLLGNSRYVVFLMPVVMFFGLGGMRLWRREVREGWWSRRKITQLLLLTTAGISVVPLFGTLTYEVIRDRYRSGLVAQKRNFYGVLQIEEYARGTPRHEVTLVHGRIDHGVQLKSGDRKEWPTSYYGPESGVGLAIRLHPERGRKGRQFRMGVVGLGTGTLAAYGNTHVSRDDLEPLYVDPVRRTPGDYLAFYEINPLVVRWSRKYFTFIDDAVVRGAEVSIFTGDARLVMERHLRAGRLQRFDVLAVDAFSSDAIPVHLLTRECFEVYEQHLTADGILAIHITNRFLRLSPVVRRIAEEMGLDAVYVEDEENEDLETSGSDWVLLSRNREFLEQPELILAGDDWPADGQGGETPPPLWTDDFSSIIPLIIFD